jgi:hypothetical protein
MSAWLVLALLPASSTHAQGAMDAWAQWALAPKVWKGQTVAWPDPAPRPSGPFTQLDSARLPVRVHVPARSSQLQAQYALALLEAAYAALQERSWPLPAPDGGYGGSLGFDLYLAADGCESACARVDEPLGVSDFDSAQTFAVVNARLPQQALRACVQSAVAQAGLRSVDPAEAESWLRASGDFAAWLITGEAGCDESFVAAQLTAASGVLDAEPRSAATGGLLLAVLSERNDGGSGDFVRALWESTRQRSLGLVDGDRLRSSPDLWEVLTQTLAQQHISVHDELVEFGIARYFAGDARRRAQAAYRVLAGLPSDASVALSADLALSDLPRHVHSEQALDSLGSAYVRVRVSDSQRSSELQVWLRGELEPRWSLSAVRLAADGHELGRTSLPARRTASQYLPIVLDNDTAEVVIVITNLPDATPDADLPAPTAHGYELIVAAASDSSE